MWQNIRVIRLFRLQTGCLNMNNLHKPNLELDWRGELTRLIGLQFEKEDNNEN